MSAYRSASAQKRARCVLLCVSCGARIGFEASEPECACPRCGLHQPTLRPAAELALGQLVHVESDGRPYDELGEFSRAVGASGRALAITVEGDGVELVVSLSLNSGTADGIDLTARTAGFPPMRLIRETPAERQAKATGVSREVQVGDPEFDAAVYIDSEASDEDVLMVLGAPAVRSAVRALLLAFSTIKIDSGRIEVTGNRDTPDCYRPDAIRRWLGALRVLAGAPRRRDLELQAPAPFAFGVQAFSWGLSPVGLLWLIVAGIQVGPFHPGQLAVLGIGAGLVSWWLWRGVLRRVLSGRSGSHTQILVASAMTFFSLPMTCVAMLFTTNAVFDRSAERVQDGKVTATSWDDENNSTTVQVRGDDLDVSFSVSDAKREVKIGDKATVWSKAGALGAKWGTRPGLVVSGGRRLVGD